MNRLLDCFYSERGGRGGGGGVAVSKYSICGYVYICLCGDVPILYVSLNACYSDDGGRDVGFVRILGLSYWRNAETACVR